MKLNIKANALHYAYQMIELHGYFTYVQPVAYKKAEELKELGYNVKAVNEYTIEKDINNSWK